MSTTFAEIIDAFKVNYIHHVYSCQLRIKAETHKIYQALKSKL